MAWTALPDGEAISITQGNYYAVVASVKDSHSQADIYSIAAGKGLGIYQYQEWPAVDGYKQVAAMAGATSSGTLPWKLPFPLSLADSSTIKQAWWSPPAGGGGGGQPTPPPAPAGIGWTTYALIGAGVLAVIAFDYYRNSRHHARHAYRQRAFGFV